MIERFFHGWLLVGLALLLGASWLAWRAWRFEVEAVTATATVLEVTTYKGVTMVEVEFDGPKAASVQARIQRGSGSALLRVGASAEVQYLPDAPEEAAFASSEGRFVPALIVAFLGLVFSVAGGVLLVRSRSQR